MRFAEAEVIVSTPSTPGVRTFQRIVTGLLVVAFAIPTWWMTGSWLQARRQQRVAALIEELGGQVTWGGDGVGFSRLTAGYIQRVNLNGTNATDEDLAQLEYLPELTTLTADGARITGRGLAHLQGLNKLVQLDLSRTQVTDDGLRHVGALPGLKILNLQATQITEAGVAHLRDLTSLEQLDLSYTQISDAALVHLASMHGLNRLELDHTRITDEGLRQLGTMTRPDAALDLSGTQVTGAGLAELKKKAPNWHVLGP